MTRCLEHLSNDDLQERVRVADLYWNHSRKVLPAKAWLLYMFERHAAREELDTRKLMPPNRGTNVTRGEEQ